MERKTRTSLLIYFKQKGEIDIRQNGAEEILRRFCDGWNEVMWSRMKERERKRKKIDGGLGV